MSQNDGAYGQEVEELSMDLSLKDPADFVIEDRIWMLKRMDFPSIDLQKHQKRNHFTHRRTA